MVPLIALLLILAIFGGLGVVAHFLWIVLLVALALWLLGWLFHAAPPAGAPRRRGWYRW